MCDNRGLFRSEASLGKVGGEHNTAEGSRDEITSTVVYATGWFHRPVHCVCVAGWFHRTCPLCLCSRMVPQSPSTVCMQPDGYTEPIYCVCVAEWLHRAHPLCLWGQMVTQSPSTVSMGPDGYTEPIHCVYAAGWLHRAQLLLSRLCSVRKTVQQSRPNISQASCVPGSFHWSSAV